MKKLEKEREEIIDKFRPHVKALSAISELIDSSLSGKSQAAVRAAEKSASKAGLPFPDENTIPERIELLEAHGRYKLELAACRDIWPEVRKFAIKCVAEHPGVLRALQLFQWSKPAIAEGIYGTYRPKPLYRWPGTDIEVNPLPNDPTPSDLQLAVEFLEILESLLGGGQG